MKSNVKINLITLNKSSLSIRHICKRDAALQKVIHIIGNISYTIHNDSFSFMIDTIIGQMLSNKVADIISNRLLQICNGVVSSDNLTALKINDLRAIGLSNKKAEYILGFSDYYRNNPNFFNNLKNKSDNEIIEELSKLRGIGTWSAKMYLIFVLNRNDVLPFEDGAFQQAFKWLYPHIHLNKVEIQEHCACWQPYSSIASRYLYRALDAGLTKTQFSLL